jgi:Glycine-rich domain-containing protein-like
MSSTLSTPKRLCSYNNCALNMSTDVIFSCDLVDLARQHRWFLEQIHALGVSSTGPSIESLRRYECLWLPMVAQHTQELLIPPPDIAWLWHCHRLAPSLYTAYCKRVFGTLLEANPPFTLALHEESCEPGSILANTQSLWIVQYPF